MSFSLGVYAGGFQVSDSRRRICIVAAIGVWVVKGCVVHVPTGHTYFSLCPRAMYSDLDN